MTVARKSRWLHRMNLKSIKDWKNFPYYFDIDGEPSWDEIQRWKSPLVFPEHDHEYLTICYWNLREKYIRGQKDFTDDVWRGIQEVYDCDRA